ncbi:MAG: hypothetical protein IIA45_12465 [Bacteroidetes bacterium]|nr:hypothetical protein [Bacteroidota bacterium]
MRPHSPLFDYIFRNRKPLLMFFIMPLLLFVFFSEIKAILVVAILALFGAFGQFYKRYIKLTSAVEFVTFGTVIVAVAYGPVAGVLFALAVSFAAEVISGNIDAFMMVYLPVRILSAILAATLPFTSIVTIGIAVTIFVNLLSQPIYLLQSDTEIRLKGVTYLVVNIFFNVLLFNLLGNFVINLT